jgi:hypothetical protein
MTEKVTYLEDKCPAFVINDKVGKVVHVVPVGMLERIRTGDLDIRECEQFPSVVRVIVDEWLRVVHGI